MPRRLEQEQQKSGRKQASAPAGVVNLLETELFTVGVGGGRYPVEISADIVPEGQEEAFARYLAEKEPPAPRGAEQAGAECSVCGQERSNLGRLIDNYGGVSMPRKMAESIWRLQGGSSPALTSGGACSGPCPTCLTPQDCAQAAFEVLQEIVENCNTYILGVKLGQTEVSVGFAAVTNADWGTAAAQLKGKTIACIIPVSVGPTKQLGKMAVIESTRTCAICCTKYMCIVSQLKALNKTDLWNPSKDAGAINSLSSWISKLNKFIAYNNDK